VDVLGKIRILLSKHVVFFARKSGSISPAPRCAFPRTCFFLREVMICAVFFLGGDREKRLCGKTAKNCRSLEDSAESQWPN